MLTITIQVVNTSYIYRNRKSIKASSHRLNHVILVGFYLVIAGIAIYTLQKTIVALNAKIQTISCHMVPWCVSIGLTLILGMVCLKTWRLYILHLHLSTHNNSHTYQTDTSQGLYFRCIAVCNRYYRWYCTSGLERWRSTTTPGKNESKC